MRGKRFLLHDPELVDGVVRCRRCGVSSRVSPGSMRSLYKALALLDNKHCSLVELDASGMPRAMR